MRFALDWRPFAAAGPYPLLDGATHRSVIAPSGDAVSEADLASHRMRHHTAVGVTVGGRVWVIFSSGGTAEDASGQMTCACSMAPGGEEFGAPVAIMPPQSAFDPTGPSYAQGSRISYPRAMVEHEGKLYGVAAVDGVGGSSTDITGLALAARELQEDGSVGPLFRVSAAEYAPLSGFDPIPHDADLGPSLFAEANIYGIWGGSKPAAALQSEWIGAIAYAGERLIEPATCRLTDGSYVRLWRRATGTDAERQRLYASRSEDGVSFGSPFRTTLPNSPAAAACLRLSDGRVAVVGNPKDGSINRDPLHLAIFDARGRAQSIRAVRQGLSDEPVYSGQGKHGAAAYPNLWEHGGTLWVSYSLRKEEIGISSVPVAEL